MARKSVPLHICLDTPAERALVNTIKRTAETLRPHGLCQYLFKLATAFTGFYETCPVLTDDEPVRASRISVCTLTARVLAKGLDILDIAAPKQMQPRRLPAIFTFG
jgi:arginyl-tRNA synthetase